MGEVYKSEHVAFKALAIVDTPKEAKLKPLSGGMRYLSIKVHLKNTGRDYRIKYQPFYNTTFFLKANDKNLKSVDVQTVKKKNYNNRFLGGGGEVTSIVTFKISKDSNVSDMGLVLYLEGARPALIQLK